jgi:beta-N-acetylhexosaminidase
MVIKSITSYKNLFCVGLLFAYMLIGCSGVSAESGSQSFRVGTNSEYYQSCQVSGTTSATTDLSTAGPSLPSSDSYDQTVAQTFIVGFPGSVDPSVVKDVVNKFHVGGIFFTGTPTASLSSKSFIDDLNQSAGVNLFVASDEEGGEVVRYPISSGNFPSAKAMGSMTDSQVEQYGEAAGKALNSAGVNVDLAPVLDLDDGSSLTSKQERAFSSDPSVVADKAGQFAKGLEDQNIVPTFKHFPGFGGAGNYDASSGAGNTDTNPVTVPSSYNLAQNVKPYSTLLSQYGSANVMLSNLYVPSLSGTTPVSLSSDVVKYLRQTLNFNGLVMTDDLSAFQQPAYAAAGKSVSLPNAISDALNAGVNMPLFTIGDSSSDSGAEAAIQSYIDAVKSNVSQSSVTSDVSTILSSKNYNDSDVSTDSQTGCCNGSGGSSTTGSGTGSSDGSTTGSQTGSAAGGSSSCCGSSSTAAGTTPVTITGNNVKDAFTFFTQNNFTDKQAAAIVGSMMGESGTSLDPTDGTYAGGYGIAQWTPFTDAAAWINAKGLDPSSLTGQLDYLLWYITKSSPSIAAAVRQANTIHDASYAWLDDFEKCKNYNTDPNGICHEDTRLNYANTVLSKYGNGADDETSEAACSGTTTTTASSGSYQNPFRSISDLRPERVDQGVDYAGQGPIYALGDGQIVGPLTNSGWDYGGYDAFIIEKLSDGPAAGDYVYMSEGCIPTTQLAQHPTETVTSSTVICNLINPGSTGIETGWADGAAFGEALAHNNWGSTVDNLQHYTALGLNYSQLLQSLGNQPGTVESGATELGNLPSGWPTWSK